MGLVWVWAMFLSPAGAQGFAPWQRSKCALGLLGPWGFG